MKRYAYSFSDELETFWQVVKHHSKPYILEFLHVLGTFYVPKRHLECQITLQNSEVIVF